MNPGIFDGARVLWYVSPGTVNESSIAEMATAIKRGAPNINGLMVRASYGQWWSRSTVAGKPTMTISSETDLRRWVDTLHAHGLRAFVWGVPRGQDVRAEIAMNRRIASCGVDAIVFDVEVGPSYFVGSPKAANEIAGAARDLGVHLGLCLDYRGTHPRDSRADQFYRHVDSLHPMCYHFHFGRPAREVLAQARQVLAPLGKPIIPALHGYSVGARRYPASDIVETGKIALELGYTGLSWFRYGRGLSFNESGLGPAELWSIARVGASEPPPPQEPALFSFVDRAGSTVDVLSVDGSTWRTRAGTIQAVPLRAQ